MKEYLLLSFLVLLFIVPTFAQNSNYIEVKKNGLYLETYLIRHDFSEGFVSINYETSIVKKRYTNIRIGLYPDFESTVSIPMTVSWITNPFGKHHFEYGVGAVFRIEHFVDPSGINEREWFYDVPAILFPIMYRYQKNKGLFFRAGINLFVS